MPNATQLDKLSVIFQKSADFILNENIGNKDKKVITGRLWIILLWGNILLTTVMLLLTYQQKGGLLLKAIIPAGPPIVISIIVWSVMEHALKTEDYNLIGGYNDKFNYNYVELRKIVRFIQGYTVIISFLSNFILFILSFFSELKEKYNYVLYLYLINLFLGIIYINLKKKKELFI